MSKTCVHPVAVQYGPCDPTGIVFFRNYPDPSRAIPIPEDNQGAEPATPATPTPQKETLP